MFMVIARTGIADAPPPRTYGIESLMVVSPATDPVLVRFRRDINAVYGEDLDRLVLFGSRARGDWRPDSDYDIAVFLKNPVGLWDDLGKLAHITTDILYDAGVVVSAKPFAVQVYHDRSPLMRDIRTDGGEF
jgi:predicted nucleotidyltransferase